ARDVDDDSSDDYTLTYDPVGNLTDDGKDYTYVYDVFGRLRMVKERGSGDLVVENRYNGLGYRIGTHYDVDVDGTVENTSDDPWYYFVYTDRWQNMATYRASDSDPKEQFFYHTAGAGGYGGSSALDAVAFRDKDANTAWSSASDGTLEERFCYEYNWRGDVVAMVDDSRNQVEDVRYSAYGIPNASPNGDTDSDGDTDPTDVTQIDTWIAGATYDVRGDLDLDGDVDAADKTAASSRSGTTLGWQVLSADDVSNRKAYPGFVNDFAASLQFHVRHRVYDAELGRWTRRDPLGYVDGPVKYQYCMSSPVKKSDTNGLVTQDTVSECEEAYTIIRRRYGNPKKPRICSLELRARIATCCLNEYGNKWGPGESLASCITEADREFAECLTRTWDSGDCFEGCNKVYLSWALACLECPKKEKDWRVKCLAKAQIALYDCYNGCIPNWNDHGPVKKMNDKREDLVGGCGVPVVAVDSPPAAGRLPEIPGFAAGPACDGFGAGCIVQYGSQ
ncbi:MAG: hypothetical protein KDD65_07450, partial [Bacteroidetes bacterium]|nr:hypothetical protein [Bacteroidota bacterium]